MKTCIYVPWYKFKQCEVRTCKNWTDKTTHKCLAVDRVRPEGSKIISDAEINYYKFAEQGISSRLIQIKRKKATSRVEAIIMLSEFIKFIKENCESGGVFKTQVSDRMEARYPLKFKKVGFENWMWEYLTDEKVLDAFYRKCRPANKLPVHIMLRMKLVSYVKLIKQLNKPV